MALYPEGVSGVGGRLFDGEDFEAEIFINMQELGDMSWKRKSFMK